MMNLFRGKGISGKDLGIDFHSHLIPGIDDGVSTLEESIQVLKAMEALGYQKVVTTPHIYKEHYDNTEEGIESAFEEVKIAALEAGVKLDLGVAAEYFMDEFFLEKIDQKKNLLCVAENYVLVESSYANLPYLWKEIFFKLQAFGYKPILAHPERYDFLYENKSLVQEFKDHGALLQMNIGAIVGAYSLPAKKFAAHLLKKGMIDLLSTDCHRLAQLGVIEKSFRKLSPAKLTSYGIKNKMLLSS